MSSFHTESTVQDEASTHLLKLIDRCGEEVPLGECVGEVEPASRQIKIHITPKSQVKATRQHPHRRHDPTLKIAAEARDKHNAWFSSLPCDRIPRINSQSTLEGVYSALKVSKFVQSAVKERDLRCN